MTVRKAAVLGAWWLCSSSMGCSFGQSNDCTNKTPGAEVRVIDHVTKAAICDATVQLTVSGQNTKLSPVPATTEAPCQYQGGSFAEKDVGGTFALYVTRAGYQDALGTGPVPSGEAGCHVAGVSQTIEMNK